MVVLHKEKLPAVLRKCWRAKTHELWTLGNTELLNERCAAVVGSRKISTVGVRRVELLTRLLVREGCCVVSGMAKGVDAVAHETALLHKGLTIAVMGTPIEQCYPSEHEDLKQRIAEVGLVISQFPSSQRVQRSNFPMRNELMAALCPITFVVEASAESGTQWQVKAAVKAGHKIGFLPSLLESPHPWVLAALDSGVGVPIRSTGDALSAIRDALGMPEAEQQEFSQIENASGAEQLNKEFDELLLLEVPKNEPKSKKKQIHPHVLLGQQGINFIATTVTEMGYLWTPTSGSSDAGIDGYIEIRDPKTGVATNMIIQVQSKATSKDWDNENDISFSYRCDERDVDYWMQGNAPVILIVSRPSSGEAYWVSLKDYFSEPIRLKKRKIEFYKSRDAFNSESASALVHLALPKDQGVYLAPPPLQEHLTSNLLPVSRYNQSIFSAKTTHHQNETVWKQLKGFPERVGGEWFLKGGKIWSFYDLRTAPWNTICSASTVESFSADTWALSQNLSEQNEFARLLKASLRSYLSARAVWAFKVRPGVEYFYFAPTKDLKPRTVRWKRQKESERTVFGPHYGADPGKVSYYRHLAFEPRFYRFANQWYLSITPTYHFTMNGKEPSKFRESYLAGIKRLERHAAVHANVEFWASFISNRDLFSRSTDFIRFADLLEFDVDFGIREAEWLSRADEEERQKLAKIDENAQLPISESDLPFFDED